MKSKFIVLIIFLLPLFALAQNKKTIDSLAKSTLEDLRDSWSLGISDSADLDIEMYNKFKRLFDSSATIEDDLNVFYEYKGFKKPGSYKASGKPLPFDIYAHDIALAVQIQSVSVDDVIDSVPDDLMKRIFRIKREVDFQKPGRYIIPDAYTNAVIKSRNIEPESDSAKKDIFLNAGIKKSEDSVYTFTSKEVVLVTMTFNPETKTISITNMVTLSNEISCANDADYDAVTDIQDSLPQAPGDFTVNGKPDYDLDGIADAEDRCPNTYGNLINKGCPVDYFYTKKAFDVFVGWQFNEAKINLPNLNRLNFADGLGNEATDILQSKKGTLQNQSLQPGVSAGGNFIFYFGKREKKIGISAGINYAGFAAGYTMDSTDPVIYTYKAYDGVNTFRRQIKFRSLHEDISYNVFNLPVMFNYRLHLGKKGNSVLKWQAGPSLMLFRNKSAYNAAMDFGGIYQIDTVGKNAITYYDYLDPASPYNVYITSDGINEQSPSPGADYVFRELSQRNDKYSFASNKSYNGNQDFKTRFTIAFNAGLDWQQKISEGLTIKAGANFVYAPLFERNKKYQPVTGNDEFQSIYYSGAKGYYSAFGVNIGIVYNW